MIEKAISYLIDDDRPQPTNKQLVNKQPPLHIIYIKELYFGINNNKKAIKHCSTLAYYHMLKSKQYFSNSFRKEAPFGTRMYYKYNNTNHHFGRCQ